MDIPLETMAYAQRKLIKETDSNVPGEGHTKASSSTARNRRLYIVANTSKSLLVMMDKWKDSSIVKIARNNEGPGII